MSDFFHDFEGQRTITILNPAIVAVAAAAAADLGNLNHTITGLGVIRLCHVINQNICVWLIH
jgi:hypothetical protein